MADGLADATVARRRLRRLGVVITWQMDGCEAQMIVGVPDHHDLNDTATGWMNLAWDTAIDEAINYREIEFLFGEFGKEYGKDKADEAIEKHWQARLKLNNAISLLQQSLEIFLKAKIAEVSPFLLITGDPQSWPSTDESGRIDFSDFKTLVAVHLCRAAKIVSATRLSDDFLQTYSRLRKERNRIVHLNASIMNAEVSKIIVEILTAHKSLFPHENWVAFRRKYLDSTGEYSDKEGIFNGDYTNDRICREVEAELSEL
jgi:hypothetical protein